mgnify:CR=1 FL=1
MIILWSMTIVLTRFESLSVYALYIGLPIGMVTPVYGKHVCIFTCIVLSASGRLKRIRKDRGLSVKEAASRLGVTGQTVYRWENGERIPDIATFVQIGKTFGVAVDELLKD